MQRYSFSNRNDALYNIFCIFAPTSSVTIHQTVKQLSFILLAGLLLLSCNEKKTYPPIPTTVVNKDTVKAEKKADTLHVDKEQQPEQPTAPSPPPSSVKNTTPSVRPSASKSHVQPQYDNMRGFDPASEDDMDDNGMSRYMDNNDDEGWD